MIKINLAATLGALNDVSKLMLEESAAYAISCGESEGFQPIYYLSHWKIHSQTFALF